MIIAITQQFTRNKHGNRINSLQNNYVDYFSSFGVKVFPIPNYPKNVAYYFEKLPISHVILSGGSDVNPKLYKEKSNSKFKISNTRDKTEKLILDIAVKKKLPVFGICRGLQFINVYFGGKLDLIAGHVKNNHEVKFIGKNIKKELGNKALVNSFHKFGVKRDKLSSSLESFAESKDGLVEGLYHHKLPIAGVQWHPERGLAKTANKKIINAFLNKKFLWKIKK